MIETRQHSSPGFAQDKIIPAQHFESRLSPPIRPPGLRLPGRADIRAIEQRRSLRRNVPGFLEGRKGPAKAFDLLFGRYRIVATDMKDMSPPDHLLLAPIRERSRKSPHNLEHD